MEGHMQVDDASSHSPTFTGDQSLEDFIKQVMGNVRGCQRACTELQGWHHYRDYVGVRRTMERVTSTITTLMNAIFHHQDIKLNLSRHKLSDQMDMIREGNDALLERINSDIDEASGLKKNANTEVLDPVIKRIEAPTSLQIGQKNIVLLASRTVQKPQLFFSEKVQNSAKEPFIPILKEKPNSLKPLSILICQDAYGNEFYSHPYEYELLHWSPDASQLTTVVPVVPMPLHMTPLTLVTSESQLKDMVEKLKSCTEFAVDLEHHSFRSYLGLACLMQISTREEDYIVDPLALRGKLTILNEVFTDPKITKVIHGADHDIFWLQRDCGVYVVNLFDTHQAAVILEYPRRSLAALLLHFCQIQANKVFQRADWRIRPLTDEFIEYARQDSHYLLYIYDLMRNELIERGNKLHNLINAVYQRSLELCLKRYEKPVVGPESHMDLYRRSRKMFNSKQMFALKELFLWRDKVAREQDESPEYVLPKHMLLQIAEVLPKEMQGILACCNPIPPLVKTELLTLHTIIREAREQPLIDIKATPVEHPVTSVQTAEPDDLTHNLICKHDLSQCEENPTDLPTLLNPRETLLGDLFSEAKITTTFKNKSDLFGELKCQPAASDHLADIKKAMMNRFMSPYERYSAFMEMKPFLEGDKRKTAVDTGDLERVSRVRDHFLSLSKNTPTKPQDIERVATDHKVAGETQANISDLERVLRVRDHFLILSKNTQMKPPDFGRVATDHKVARETQVNEEGLVMDSEEEEGQQMEDVKAEGLSADETAGGEDGNSAETSQKLIPSQHSSRNKPIILEDLIKGKKAKKALKRKSSDNTELSNEIKKTKKKKDTRDSIDGEGESGSMDTEAGQEESGSTLEHGEQSPGQAFDYDTADYSVFRKAKVKEKKKQQIKEKFKGKNQKGRRGKSSMKSFMWGSHKGQS